MLRIILCVIKVIPNLVYSFFFSIFHLNKNKYSKVYIYNTYAHQINEISRKIGIEYVITGLENLPSEQSYLICPNHQGMLDAFVFFYIFKNEPISYVGKESLKKMPLIGRIFKQINSLFINRDDLRQEIKTMKKVQKSLKNDDCKWIIFPEGTRTRDTINYQMNPFKAGTFKFPMSIKKKIIPCALYGSHNVLDTHNKKFKNKIYVHFFAPISENEYEGKSTQEVSNMCQDMIQEKVNEFHLLAKKDD